MKRWPARILCGLCVLLAVGTAGLWIRGRMERVDRLTLWKSESAGAQFTYEIGSSWGQVGLSVRTDHKPPLRVCRPTLGWSGLGFAFWRQDHAVWNPPRGYGLFSRPPAPCQSTVVNIFIPHAFLFLLFLALAFWTGGLNRRWLKRRRPGRCLHCGYDLRGTPGKCPECGQAVDSW